MPSCAMISTRAMQVSKTFQRLLFRTLTIDSRNQIEYLDLYGTRTYSKNRHQAEWLQLRHIFD